MSRLRVSHRISAFISRPASRLASRVARLASRRVASLSACISACLCRASRVLSLSASCLVSASRIASRLLSLGLHLGLPLASRVSRRVASRLSRLASRLTFLAFASHLHLRFSGSLRANGPGSLRTVNSSPDYTESSSLQTTGLGSCEIINLLCVQKGVPQLHGVRELKLHNLMRVSLARTNGNRSGRARGPFSARLQSLTPAGSRQGVWVLAPGNPQRGINRVHQVTPFRTLAPGNPQRGIDRVHHTSPGRWPKATHRAGSAKVTTPTLQDAGPRQPAARHRPSPPHVTRALAQGYPPSGVCQGHHTNPSGRWPPATRSAASTESTTRHPGAGPRLPAERSPPRSPHQPCLGAGPRLPAKGPPKSPHHPLALGEPPCGVGRGHHFKRSYQPPRFPSFSGAVLALGSRMPSSGRGGRSRGTDAVLGRILYFCSTRSMAASAVPDFCSPDSHHRTSHHRSLCPELRIKTCRGTVLRSLLHACAQSA